MNNRFWLAFVTAGLAGCTSVSHNISSGNFKYASEDVVVTPFGSNYSISIILESEGSRFIAKTYAADCDGSFGNLMIEGKSYSERLNFKVIKGGEKKEDKIFDRLCQKGLPIAYAMENKLSESDKQKRDQAVQNYLNQPRQKPASNRVYVVPQNPASGSNQGVNCVTTNYPGASYTNCTPQ